MYDDPDAELRIVPLLTAANHQLVLVALTIQMDASVIVDFVNRKVHSVRVIGHADGMYMEAVDSAKTTKPDSAKTTKDSKPAKKPAEIKKP